MSIVRPQDISTVNVVFALWYIVHLNIIKSSFTCKLKWGFSWDSYRERKTSRINSQLCIKKLLCGIYARLLNALFHHTQGT